MTAPDSAPARPKKQDCLSEGKHSFPARTAWQDGERSNAGWSVRAFDGASKSLSRLGMSDATSVI